jgi:hypothetical protein
MFGNIIFFQNISVSVYMCKNRKSHWGYEKRRRGSYL